MTTDSDQQSQPQSDPNPDLTSEKPVPLFERESFSCAFIKIGSAMLLAFLLIMVIPVMLEEHEYRYNSVQVDATIISWTIESTGGDDPDYYAELTVRFPVEDRHVEAKTSGGPSFNLPPEAREYAVEHYAINSTIAVRRSLQHDDRVWIDLRFEPVFLVFGPLFIAMTIFAWAFTAVGKRPPGRSIVMCVVGLLIWWGIGGPPFLHYYFVTDAKHPVVLALLCIYLFSSTIILAFLIHAIQNYRRDKRTPSAE